MTPAGVGLAIVEKVVADRDRLLRGFRCISELLWVSSEPGSPGMDLYATDGIAVRDGATDDFEERDLIFQRISNLITVRSDVFTAYILVRIGTDGPQRRVIAIHRVHTRSYRDRRAAKAGHRNTGQERR